MLLALQVAIPWTTGHYITQDGPSHLYTAIVTKDLLLHPHGFYSSVYLLQHRLVTNWSTTLLLGALVPIFGASHAEAALATLCILIGFVCLTYFRKSLNESLAGRGKRPLTGPLRSPGTGPRLGKTDADSKAPTEPSASVSGNGSPVWDPLSNFLLNSWFLWAGFYNFYLGMALCVMLVGFYMLYLRDLTRQRTALLAGGLLLLFFTHVLPAVLALMAIAFVTGWEWVCGFRPNRRALLTAIAPVVILLAFFVRKSVGRVDFQADAAGAWGSFPQHVFASARGRVTEEAMLVPAMLFLLAVGLLALTKVEWSSVRLPLAAASLAAFAGYLFGPDTGFGGGGIKIRLAWAVFLFGCPIAASGARMRALRIPVSIYIACFMAGSLIVTGHLVRRIGVVADLYSSALEQIPDGSIIVRVQYAIRSHARALRLRRYRRRSSVSRSRMDCVAAQVDRHERLPGP